jgi:signal transduction histidine kinase
MSVSAAAVAQSSPSQTTPTRDPPRLQLFSVILTATLTALLIRSGDSLVATVLADWKSLLFWGALITLVSVFPISVDDALLTVDEPILLALALLYPPEVAAFVALFASLDVREFKGEIVFARALYNRAQVGLSVYLAGATFRFVTGGELDPWPIAVMGTGAAVAAEYLANVLLVSLHARVRWGLDLASAVGKLKVGRRGQFLATYLGYGTLALVLAQLFRVVGAWSAVAFILPILVARQMLVRGQALQTLSEKLRSRDRMLQSVSNRILDERSDERSRLAGDLHDDVLQALTRVWLSARLLQKQQEKATGSASDDLTELVEASEDCIDSFRRVIHGLKEWPSGWSGLMPTLKGLVRDLRLEWKAKIQLSLPDAVMLEPATQFVIYQVVREAIVNSLKHARASLISVSLENSEHEVAIRVDDDGAGFSMQSVESPSHFGIHLMRERARSVGGNLRIASEKGKGTHVRGTFPT